MGKNDDAPDGLQMAVQLAQTVKAVASKSKLQDSPPETFPDG